MSVPLLTPSLALWLQMLAKAFDDIDYKWLVCFDGRSCESRSHPSTLGSMLLPVSLGEATVRTSRNIESFVPFPLLHIRGSCTIDGVKGRGSVEGECVRRYAHNGSCIQSASAGIRTPLLGFESLLLLIEAAITHRIFHGREDAICADRLCKLAVQEASR